MRQYERALRRARTLANLKAIELQVRTDAKLRFNHRNKLLKRVEHSVRLAAKATTSPSEDIETNEADSSMNAQVPLS
jgi:hypothetical protein